MWEGGLDFSAKDLERRALPPVHMKQECWISDLEIYFTFQNIPSSPKQPVIAYRVHTHTHARMYAHTHKHAHTQHTRTHRHAHTHAHTHTHTHTHTQTHTNTQIHTDLGEVNSVRWPPTKIL